MSVAVKKQNAVKADVQRVGFKFQHSMNKWKSKACTAREETLISSDGRLVAKRRGTGEGGGKRGLKNATQTHTRKKILGRNKRGERRCCGQTRMHDGRLVSKKDGEREHGKWVCELRENVRYTTTMSRWEQKCESVLMC